MFKFVSTLAIASVVAVPVAFAAPGDNHDHHHGPMGHHPAPHHMAPHHMDHRMHYMPGHSYRSAPHGWHRYHSRPGDWQTRGCILVGPVWFCP